MPRVARQTAPQVDQGTMPEVRVPESSRTRERFWVPGSAFHIPFIHLARDNDGHILVGGHEIHGDAGEHVTVMMLPREWQRLRMAAMMVSRQPVALTAPPKASAQMTRRW